MPQLSLSMKGLLVVSMFIILVIRIIGLSKRILLYCFGSVSLKRWKSEMSKMWEEDFTSMGKMVSK